MSELPLPMTDPNADLRGMPYMPLDLHSLFESDFYALASGDEFKAALTLWGKSFYQIPAGSLPDNEKLLAHLSGAKNWKTIKKMALYGWVKCADGRLYHTTVALKVAEAWEARLMRRSQTKAARQARLKNNTRTGAVTEPLTDNVALEETGDVTGSKGTEQKGTEQKGTEQTDSLTNATPNSPHELDGFEAFWSVYPRKVGKGQARRAFVAALKKTPIDALLRALRQQSFDPREQFQPHPATWLNGERWLDEKNNDDPVLRAAGVVANRSSNTEDGLSFLQ